MNILRIRSMFKSIDLGIKIDNLNNKLQTNKSYINLLFFLLLFLIFANGAKPFFSPLLIFQTENNYDNQKQNNYK